MPCAAGEFCLPRNLTPKAPDGHQCRGGCGGRRHGICGDVEEDGESELNRICPACVSSKQASTVAAGKRKAQDAGCIPKLTKEDGSMGGGVAEPSPYAELSQHFGPLENYAAGCGLGEASYFLKRARMLMIETHALKPSRQADVRAYFDA